MKRVLRFLPDTFSLSLLATVALGSILPCQGQAAEVFEHLTSVAIALLFFLHGAKLSREAIIAGLTHWRLHLVIFSGTFILFPIIGLLMRPLGPLLLTNDLMLGLLFLCALPSTVQSSIAFTSIAGGNVPAAICSASASNLFGVFLTPLLVTLMMKASGEGLSFFDAVTGIILQILVPFVAVQIARRWIGAWVQRHRLVVRCVDQGSILMVVYGAFSEAVVNGLWQQIPLISLCWLFAVSAVMLGIVMITLWIITGLMGFKRPDRITIVFCGSKKSLASGVPIANVLFPAQLVGPMVLPLMVFHQIQLMVCAALARRWGASTDQEKEIIQTIE